MLSPHEFQALFFRQILLNRVVSSLDQHAIHPDAFQHVSHCRTHTERIYGPSIAREKEILDKVTDFICKPTEVILV